MIQSETIIACASPAHKASILPKVNCPLCQDGRGPARFTHLALTEHLHNVHGVKNAAEMANDWYAKQGGV